jgi:hypothetical protein
MSYAEEVSDAAYALQLIVRDINSGVIPATVRSFEDLHDHVDVNEYIAFTVPDGPMTDEQLKHVNAVVRRIDDFLRGRS